MSLETETSLGTIVFEDGEWDQARADSDALSWVFWIYPVAATAHQTRLFKSNTSGLTRQFDAEWRDAGAQTDALGLVRTRATTVTFMRCGNSDFIVNEWNFGVYVDNGDGNAPNIYIGQQDTQVAEIASYGARLTPAGAVTNSHVTNNIPLILMGNNPDDMNSAAAFRMAYFAMYDVGLTEAQAQAIQFNPWAHYDDCLFQCFPGNNGAGVGQIDHAGGFSNSTSNGTPTLSFDSPNGVNRFPQIGGGWHPGLQAATAQIISIGVNAEVDTSQTISSAKLRDLGINTETDLAQVFAGIIKGRAIGLNTESDIALAMVSQKLQTLGIITETDLALAISTNTPQIIGLNVETDQALIMSIAKLRAIGINTEIDTALALSILRAYNLGIVTETDTAQTLANIAKSRAIGLSVENDQALAMTVVGGAPVGPAAESMYIIEARRRGRR